jgi:hypothetical protein
MDKMPGQWIFFPWAREFFPAAPESKRIYDFANRRMEGLWASI